RLPLSVGIVAITRHGTGLALQLQKGLPGSVCYVPKRHDFALAMGAAGYGRLGTLISKIWPKHDALICIMATGIVVRLIAPLLKHKAQDPAVVVLDEKGKFVISLLSGHLGGANRLAQRVAQMVEGQAIITTASDVHHKPALDLIAKEARLEIENPGMVARLTRSFLENETIWIFDPGRRLRDYLKNERNLIWLPETRDAEPAAKEKDGGRAAISAAIEAQPSAGVSPGIWVSEYLAPASTESLHLRPHNLVVGLGCNKGTSSGEMIALLQKVFADEKLSMRSIRNIASIDLKAEEPAILETAEWLDRPIQFYSGPEIKNVSVPNPSDLVEIHVGVASVCEAAALLSAQPGDLIIPKRKTANVTLAVARAI
ncbi:MAG: cobalamin biosynthesis protein, partial [Desulforhabdus sp.]|nr:cobalamin biosynthesis protein [Desulforhabdus sp.]